MLNLNMTIKPRHLLILKGACCQPLSLVFSCFPCRLSYCNLLHKFCFTAKLQKECPKSQKWQKDLIFIRIDRIDGQKKKKAEKTQTVSNTQKLGEGRKEGRRALQLCVELHSKLNPVSKRGKVQTLRSKLGVYTNKESRSR